MRKHVLTEHGEFEVDSPDGLRLTAADLARTTGWMLKPEGLCLGDICVPRSGGLVEGRIDVASFWNELGQPVISDDAGGVWALGAGATARRDALASLEAPDFELPDLAGVPHRLSSLRGKKVFLATWASW
jgi:hypothetical protein